MTDTHVRKMASFPGGGLYVGRPLVNVSALQSWAQEYGIQLVSDPHVTVVYSRADVVLPLDRPSVVVPAADLQRIGPLGPSGAIVLFLDAPALSERWREARDLGASWDYPTGYRAHMTLTFTSDSQKWDVVPGTQVDWAKVKLPPFPLVFGPEAAGPIAASAFSLLFGTAYDVLPLMKGDTATCTHATADECTDPSCAMHSESVKKAIAAFVADDVAKGLPLRKRLEARTPHTIAALRADLTPGVIRKSDAVDQQLVSGWAIVSADAEHRPLIDRQNQIMPLDVVAKAARAFLDNLGTLGTLHLRKSDDKDAEPIPFGWVTEGLVVTPVVKALLDLPTNTPFGFAITARVENAVVWKAVKEKRLEMFSVGGRGTLVHATVKNPSPTSVFPVA